MVFIATFALTQVCLVQRVLPNRKILVWTLDQNACCSVNSTVRQTVNQCRFRPDSSSKALSLQKLEPKCRKVNLS